MVRKTDSAGRTVAALRAAPAKNLAAAKPKAKGMGKDELSTGVGSRLKAAALGVTGATARSALAQVSTRDALGVKAGALLRGGMAALNAQATALSAAAQLSGTPASKAVQDQAKQRMELVNSPEAFAYALQAEPDPAVRNEMVRQAMNSDHPDAYLGPPGGVGGNQNQELDVMKTVAGAVDSAVQAGAVKQADVNAALGHMDQETAEFVIQGLQIDGSNRALGGAVEMFGLAARDRGYDRAAAIALTSTDSLIDKYYPTAAQQQQAFEQVKNFVEDFDDRVGGDEHDPAGPHSALQFALGSAARLTARGNGYSPDELDAELKSLGPRFVEETLARLGEATRFDGRVPGPIDTLADSATRLADQGGKKADQFRLAASIGYTQSTQLITQNLHTPAERRRALDGLNAFLADRRGAFGDAANADPPYTLLRDPQAIEGITNLLSADPALLPSLLNGGPEGEATLVQLFESITLNPNVPAALRDDFQRRIDGLMATELAKASQNPNETGAEIGRLLGLIQVAGNRVVEAAGKQAGPTQDALKDFVKDVTGGIVGALLATTGPVGSIVGGAVMNQVLGAIFGSSPGPSEAQVRNAFVAQLEQLGINVSSGEAGFDALQTVLGKALDALINTRPQTPAIQDQINRLESLKNSIDTTFGGSIDSEGGAAGELARALDGREDNPR